MVSNRNGLRRNIKNRLDIFTILHNTQGTNYSHPNGTIVTTYKLIYKWEELGLIEVSKEGRNLKIEFTPQGREYYRVLTQMIPYLDFFE
jgi:DNA-binding PadR family transcriptional regulator